VKPTRHHEARTVGLWTHIATTDDLLFVLKKVLTTFRCRL